MAKSGRSNPFGSAMAIDVPRPENGRQCCRRTRGGDVRAKAEVSVASRVGTVKDGKAEEAKKAMRGAMR